MMNFIFLQQSVFVLKAFGGGVHLYLFQFWWKEH